MHKRGGVPRTEASSKEGELGTLNTPPNKKSTRQRITDGEWADLIAEKGHSAGVSQSEPFNSDVVASIHMEKLAAHNGDELPFHMYFKLAKLEHYIRRDTPRKLHLTH